MRRTEATPKVDKLTRSQQRCRDRILEEIAQRGKLVNDVEQMMVERRQSIDSLGLAKVDDRRHSNAVFIDSARGAGKTTTLLSIVDECNQYVLRGARQDGQSIRGSRPPIDAHASLEAHTLESSQTIPLTTDIIDFVRISDETPVLMLFAQAFERLLNGLIDQSTQMKCRAPNGGDLCEPVMEAWEELKRAALGRSKLPTPSSLSESAWQLGELVRGFLSLDEIVHNFALQFERVWRRLHSQRFASGARVVFVIPVDDADAHASRSRELVQLARAIHHPQMLFVLAGDTSIIHHVLVDRYLLDFAQGSSKVRDAAQQWTKNGLVLAERLATDVIDRVIPPVARARLDAVSYDEALSLRVSVANGPAELVTSIHEILRSGGPESGDSEPPTPNPYLPIDLSTPGVERGAEVASFSALFPTRMREIVDLADRLRTVRQQHGTFDWRSQGGQRFLAATTAKELFEAAVNQTALPELDPMRARVRLSSGSGYGHATPDDFTFGVRSVGLRVNIRPSVERRTLDEQADPREPRTFEFATFDEVVLEDVSSKSRHPFWNERVTATLLFANEVANHLYDSLGNDSEFLPKNWHWIKSTIELGEQRIPIGVPLPAWGTWFSFARFDMLWSWALRSVSAESTAASLAAIGVVCAVIATLPPESSADLVEALEDLLGASAIAERRWEHIAELIHKAIRAPESEAALPRRDRIPLSQLRQWLSTVAGVLLSPEFGACPAQMPPSQQPLNLLLEKITVRESVQRSREALCNDLARRYGSQTAAKLVSDWLAKHQKDPGHAWRHVTGSVDTDWTRLMEALDNIALPNAAIPRYTLRRLLEDSSFKSEFSEDHAELWAKFFLKIKDENDLIQQCLSRAAEGSAPESNFIHFQHKSTTITASAVIALQNQRVAQHGQRTVYYSMAYRSSDRRDDATLARWVLHDLAADEADASIHSITNLGGNNWTLFGHRESLFRLDALRVQSSVQANSVLSAFVPAFSALVDLDLLLTAWNAATTVLIRAERPALDRLDAPANAIVTLLRKVQNVYSDRVTGNPPHVKREGHENLITELFDQPRIGNKHRDDIFEYWRSSVVLYAMPEYCLPSELCEFLIAKHTAKYGSNGAIPPEELERLRKLRAECLINGTPNRGQVEPLNAPDHPWTRLFAPPTPSSPPPSSPPPSSPPPSSPPSSGAGRKLW